MKIFSQPGEISVLSKLTPNVPSDYRALLSYTNRFAYRPPCYQLSAFAILKNEHSALLITLHSLWDAQKCTAAGTFK